MLISLSRSSSSAIACTIIVSTLSGENLSLNLEPVSTVSFKQGTVPGERVGETELHRADVLGVDVAEQGRKLSADSTVEVVHGGV